MELRQKGTPPYYRDGTLLGTEGPLTPFENAGVLVTSSLTPYHSYTFHLCAVYGAAPNIYCTSMEYGITWTPPEGTPTPTITSGSSTQTSITFGWSTFPQYNFYNVLMDGGNQHQVTGASFTYNDLQPGVEHTVQVEGCIGQGYNDSNCSPFSAEYSIKTKPAPPVAAPQDLRATVSEGPIGHFTVSITWVVPMPEQSQVIQDITKPSGGSLSYFPPVQNGVNYREDDTNVASGQRPVYKVCLTDITQPNNPPVCSETALYIPVPCAFALSCPIQENNPPAWTISCGKPTDFYSDSGPAVNLSTPNPTNLKLISKGANSASGVTTTEQVIVASCLPGTTDRCSSNSIQVSQAQWCKSGSPPPPPPPPTTNCKVCVENGGQCVTVNGKKICRNL
jgi:hypothetical protein